MKKRKERIEEEKALQFTENFKSVKKATTYLGTTVLMGTAGVALGTNKALADTTVQVQSGQHNGTNTASGAASGVDPHVASASSASDRSLDNTTTQSGQSSVSSAKSNTVGGSATAKGRSGVKTTKEPQNNTSIVPKTKGLLSTYSTKSVSSGSFLQQLVPAAKQVAKQRGLYASLMIAQAILESGWGNSVLAIQDHNLFGVKWNGQGAYHELPTQEFYGGKYHQVRAKFQKYSSYADSLNNYATLIVNHFPDSTLAATNSVEQAADKLAKGRYGAYATDPNYAATVKRLINNYGLKQYDSKVSGTPTTLPNSNTSQPTQTSNTSTGSTGKNTAVKTYTVKRGDSLYRIGQRYGSSVQELKNWNHLSGDTIYIGQVLTVQKQGSVGTKAPVKTPSTPAPQPAKQAPADNNSKTYQVKAHDSLWSIAQVYKTTVAQLRSWNKLTNDIIYVGQKLVIGQATSSSKAPAPRTPVKQQPAATSPADVATYTVKKSDNLWSIAHAHGLTVQRIKSLNNLKTDLIFIGQRLKLAEPQKSKPVKNNNTVPKKDQSNVGKTANNWYTVSSGDSLWSIAQKRGMTVSSLKSLNKLTSDLIHVGQKLRVAGTRNSSAPTKTSAPTANNSANKSTYVVKKNDSLWSIANAYNTTIGKLRQLNHLTGSVIYIGQTLRVKSRPSINADSHPNSSTPAKSSYQVQKHDSLWRIATRNKLTVNQLKALNHLVSDTIYVGQTLKLK